MKNLHESLVGALIGLSAFLVLLAWGGLMAGDSAVPIAKNAGLVAWLLLWGSTLCGLLLSTRVSRLRPAFLNDLHQYLSLAGLAFTAFHALMFLGGTKHPVSLLEVLVPFAWPGNTLFVALGQIAAPLMAAVVVTSLARRRVGNRAWRVVHMAAFAAFALGLVHVLGTDHHKGWLYLSTAVPVVYLTTLRIGLSTMRPLASAAPRG